MMKMNKKIRLIQLILLAAILMLSGCGNQPPADLAENNPEPTAVEMPTVSPSTTPEASPTVEEAAKPDLGNILVQLQQSSAFKIGYVPLNTWVDEEGMHATFMPQDIYEDWVDVTLHCGEAPFEEKYAAWVANLTPVPNAPAFGDSSQVYYAKLNSTQVKLLFRSGKCVAAINAWQDEEIQGTEIGPWMEDQVYGMAAFIEERFKDISYDQGLLLPPMGEQAGLFDATFRSFDLYRWEPVFRSYSIDMEAKVPFIKKSTFAVYDQQRKYYVMRRDVYNFPVLGANHLDNLGECRNMEEIYKTLLEDGDYLLYIWIDDQLATVIPLE